jgi:aspartate-semialdehyde dehydrogenase
VASLDILGNVIPFIRNEEPKVEEETLKMLGRFTGSAVELASMKISALCHRVPVIEGHTEAVSVKLKGNPGVDAVREAFLNWKPEPQRLGLFSAPAIPVHVHTLEDRPQVRRDVERDEGMSVHVGRIRVCPILGLKFALLGHNTERGAAGGSILNAELAHAKGYLR